MAKIENHRPPVLWGFEGDEYLYHTELDDFIQDWLNSAEFEGEPPKTLKVCGFARMEIAENEPALDAENILENILENLDAEYGWDDCSEPTEGMKLAAKLLMRVIRNEYKPWTCEVVRTVEVNLATWMRANNK